MSYNGFESVSWSCLKSLRRLAFAKSSKRDHDCVLDCLKAVVRRRIDVFQLRHCRSCEAANERYVSLVIIADVRGLEYDEQPMRQVPRSRSQEFLRWPL